MGALETSYELMELMDKKLAIGARSSLLKFALYTRPQYQANWHHKKLCKLLDRFVSGDAPRVMVFMPPQHGKSELVSRCLPAYIHGVDPDCSIIATSYSADLSSRMNRDVQRIIDSDEYGRVFPGTRLNRSNVKTIAQGSWLRNSDIYEVVDRRGSYRSAGVGGGITGMGGDYLIIDDPIKSQEDANSIVYREKTWDWYVSTFYSRRKGDHAGVLITLTRWHEDDLAGRLLRLAASDLDADQWEVLSLPAIKEGPPDDIDPREFGEALWANRFSAETLLKNRANGEYFWNALYQQRPSSIKGNIIKREWIRYYDELPEGLTGHLQSWDLTSKGKEQRKSKRGSYVVGQIWARKGADFYMIDQYRGQPNMAGTLAAIRSMSVKHPLALLKLIEDAATGAATQSLLKDEIPGIVLVGTKGQSKEDRLDAVSPMLEAGNVWLPRWCEELVEELVSFPTAANDDQVDSLSMALNRFRTDPSCDIKLDMSFGLKAESWRY